MDTTSTPTAPPAAAPSASAAPTDARRALLRDPSLRWLLAGSFISLLGDQFTLIALPWAALQLSHDPLVLGIVLAMVGVPRAAFILVGGAFVDRYSPQRVLMLSKHANTLLLGVLAIAIGLGRLDVTGLCLLALGIGVAAAFGIPAATSMLPQIVAPHQLPAANGLTMGLRQITMFIGPLLAGLLIATTDGTAGLAAAFAVDAASFALSAWTLSKVVTRPRIASSAQAVLHAVAEGLRHCWNDRQLRALLAYGSAVSLLIAGPLQTALPVLAASVPGLGAGGLGTMLGAHGGGMLIGLAVAAARPGWRLGTLGATVLAIDACVGLLIVPIGRIDATWQGAVLLLVTGACAGFVQVRVFSWLQRRVPPALMGRAMSVFMFVFVGLAPLSAAAAGVLLRWLTPATLFAAAGGLLVVLVGIALAWPGSPMRRLGEAAA
jgi:MFS family permease